DRFRVPGLDQSARNREWPNAREHIAAVGRGVDQVPLDRYLREQVLDIETRTSGCGDNHDFAALLIAAAQSIDLAEVGGAHYLEQQAVPQLRIGRQVRSNEEQSLRRPATH